MTHQQRFKIKNHKLLAGVLLGAAFTLLLFAAGWGRKTAQAALLNPVFTSTDGWPCTEIEDGDYFTTEFFDPGTEVTLEAEEPIDSLYIVWENVPGEWILRIDGKDYTFGQEGYLHEFVEIPEQAKGATSVTLIVGSARITIADLYAFSAGTLPDFVQKWNPSYEEADILLISTHADDEVLFFGGIIPTYADRGNVRIQLAYFSDFFQSEPYRNHEILNGLWTMGVTHYPQLGEFYDNYSESLEEAEGQFDYDDCLSYIVRTIRRFKPQVVIGQDIINGEYGHGGHMWSAKLIADALDLTGDTTSYADSALKYGTWEVPKTYFHLYPENVIEINARIPLASFGGKTALEVAKLAYLEHQSQQWCWFQVSDGYDEYGNQEEDKFYLNRCTLFGLYRSLVGADDTGSDILEHITTYDEQERLAAQAALQQAEAETQNEDHAADALSLENPSAESVLDGSPITTVPGGKNTTLITILIVIAIILLLAIIGVIVISHNRRKLRERQRRLERRRRIEASRNRTAAGRTIPASRERTADNRFPDGRTGNSRVSKQGSYRR